jgi:hypothetical protein
MQNIELARSSVKKYSLADLEHVAVAAHIQIERLEGDMSQLDRERLPLAMKAGDALIEIVERKLVKHGQRSALYIKTCGSVRMGQIYITLAANRELVEANTKCVSHLGINAALKLIRKANGTSKPKPTKALVSVHVATFNKMSDAERTEALAAIGFDAVWPALPQDFYPKIESRLATSLFNRAKKAQPNTRLKRFRPKLVFDAERGAALEERAHAAIPCS